MWVRRSRSLIVSLIYQDSVIHDRGAGKVHKPVLRDEVNRTVDYTFKVGDNLAYGQQAYTFFAVVMDEYVYVTAGILFSA